jgi:hypothetical protein
MAVFVAEIEIETNSLATLRTLGRGKLCLIEPTLKGGPYVWRNLLHGSGFGGCW